MSLHLRLKNLRQMRKLSQQQMADLLHMSRPNYTKLEARPGNIRIELLRRIATVLKVPVALLMSAQTDLSPPTPWNDFDFMLEMAYEHYSWKLTVVSYDDLTLEQLALLTSRGFGSREKYEDTPLRGRLYSYGPRQILDELFRGLSFSTLFELHLVEHPIWLNRWQQHQQRQSHQAMVAKLPAEEREAFAEEPEVDEREYLVVLMITLTMPDGSEQHLELAHRDIPEGLDEEQALQQLITSRGASDGDILAFTFDGYTTHEEIVTDIYAKC